MDDIKNSIMKNVKITDEILNAAIDKLKELGCESIADCTYLREEDLCPPLKVIRAENFCNLGSNPVSIMSVSIFIAVLLSVAGLDLLLARSIAYSGYMPSSGVRLTVCPSHDFVQG